MCRLFLKLVSYFMRIVFQDANFFIEFHHYQQTGREQRSRVVQPGDRSFIIMDSLTMTPFNSNIEISGNFPNLISKVNLQLFRNNFKLYSRANKYSGNILSILYNPIQLPWSAQWSVLLHWWWWWCSLEDLTPLTVSSSPTSCPAGTAETWTGGLTYNN